MVKKLLDLKGIKLTEFSGEDGIRIENISNKDIAIIGMSGRFAGTADIGGFLDILMNGQDCIRDIPKGRKRDSDNFLHIRGMDIEKLEYSKLGYMDEIDKFDCKFFSISPREASLMDPSQRILLETIWKSIEDGGYGGGKLAGSKTGVYIGHSGDIQEDYRNLISEIDSSLLGLSIPGNIRSIIASRISYILDLRGPAMIVDTACSSSLVAVHLACQSIRSGECELAVAGGININLLPYKREFQGDVGIESADGRAKTFDDSSDGTGGGEGVAAILLKPLSRAIDDGDNIYAVIKGSASNQDGSSIGITAPNSAAQEDVVLTAWKDAGIDPTSISYIEAHGTGTKLGDPIEIDGIERAFKKYTKRRQFCGIGSVKTNIGHLDSAAGIASLIKAVLSLKYKKLFPSLHFKQPNRKINFEESPVYVNDRLRDWETDGAARRCGVSAFGLSGTNCHVILEEAPKSDVKVQGSDKLQVLTLSAKSESSLKELVSAYKSLANSDRALDISDMCFTANTGRGHYNYRVAMIVSDWSSFKRKIEALDYTNIKDSTREGLYLGRYTVVPVNKADREEWEITEDERRLLSKVAEEKLAQLLQAKEEEYREALQELCRLYVQGADVQWQKLYEDRKHRRVSLPTYAFERERCWLDLPDANSGDENTYHTITWRPEQLEKRTDEVCNNGGVLVFKDDRGIGEELAKRLRAKGRNVIEVDWGTEFGWDGENKYTVGSAKVDYTRLLDEIRKYSVSTIYHMMSIGSESGINNVEELDTTQKRGVHSLFNLVKALTSSKLTQKIDILLVSKLVHKLTGEEPVINPYNATLFGLGKVIGQEYHNLNCKCIDIDETTAVDCILAEEAAKGSYFAAYRNSRRYVEELDKLELAKESEKEIQIKHKGTYIITGGTGGIGLEIGRFLASKDKINLVLISRTGLPERESWDSIIESDKGSKLCSKIQAIRDMEAQGSRIYCYKADVSDHSSMEKLLEEIRLKFGSIDGIIHAAGIAGDGFIINKDEKTFGEVLSPKVYGTWILDSLTHRDNLDFFVMFSSLTSVAGAAGQGDYTAANCYMDAFAHYRSKQGKRTLTINWPAWKETGMAVDHGVKTDNGFVKPIDTDKAVRVFEKALNSGVERVIIGEFNYDMLAGLTDNTQLRLSAQIKSEVKKPQLNTIEKGHKKPLEVEITGGQKGGYTPIQQKLAQIWAEVLGVKAVSIYDNFYESGGDSILATRLLREMEKEYPGLLSISDVFSYPTIAEMSAYIEKELTPKEEAIEDDDSELDDILDRLADGSLSVSEVAKLMGDEDDL
ncbi:MAG: SDR family NAD(P)-dependent oxidoreductase [Clostridia bacterium]|nr:SDR family NAD(P)-dependent oxidoreductase [Clostridia bacterium]